MNLKTMTKAQLIECIRTMDADRALSSTNVLKRMERARRKVEIENANAMQNEAAKLREEYSGIMAQYAGKRLCDIPRETMNRVMSLLTQAQYLEEQAVRMKQVSNPHGEKIDGKN